MNELTNVTKMIFIFFTAIPTAIRHIYLIELVQLISIARNDDTTRQYYGQLRS